ncbi:MAG: carbohydrate kinase [Bacteroidia bacterium]|nr:carbohydrate kinase [Bacteroidia bacterium]
MRKIYTIGETIFDVIFKNDEPLAGKVGGAVLNTSATLGRLNIPVYFISEFGKDYIGSLVQEFLKQNKINSDSVGRYTDGKTSLAIAALDKNNNASYNFYKIYPKDRLNIVMPLITENDMVLFGSSYALYPEIHKNVKNIVKNAQSKNAIVLYDPNIRNSYRNEIQNFETLLLDNIAHADIIRCSEEDVSAAFGIENPDNFYKILKGKDTILIFTAGKKGIVLMTPAIHKRYDVPSITPVSTIGAGDNFNAGIMYSILKNNILKKDLPGLSIEHWDEIIQTGIDFATHVCLSMDNYISDEFAKKYRLA